jgi:hypothetical protein
MDVQRRCFLATRIRRFDSTAVRVCPSSHGHRRVTGEGYLARGHSPLSRSRARASFGFSVFPGGNARVRVQMSAAIEAERIAAPDKVGKELGLL